MNGAPLYLGIDPGVAGGIAAVNAEGRAVATTKMPESERELLTFFQNLAAATLDEGGQTRIRAVLERVSSSPQMGVVSAFTFGRGVGQLRMALLAAEIPFDEVTPGVWQKAMGVRQQTGKTTLGATHVKDKNIAKRRAQDLFPTMTITHALADALLIAEFCRRSHALAPMQATA
jgi:crossover junction endodeoxyribonuclease RuvC